MEHNVNYEEDSINYRQQLAVNKHLFDLLKTTNILHKRYKIYDYKYI